VGSGKEDNNDDDDDDADEVEVLETVAMQAERPQFKPRVSTVLDDLRPRADPAEVLRSLWRLVAVGRLRMDFRKGFMPCHKIWAPAPSEARPLLLPLELPGLYRG